MEFVASIDTKRSEATYAMTLGTQVRVERMGLLFYQRRGPRLFFIASGDLIDPEFFSSGRTLKEWLSGRKVSAATIEALERALAGLETKGVLSACDRSP